MKRKITFTFGLIALLLTMWSPLFSKNTTNDVVWSLICPDDVTVDCNAEIWDLSSYGNATYHDHNGYHSAGTPIVKYYINGCGGGYVTRTWTVEDPYWNNHSCTQTITVGGAAFNSSSIQWPAMVTLEGCDPNTSPDVTGKPTWVPSECSMIGYSYKDALYTVSADCKKILRKWTLIDWCMNGNQPQSWTYTQTIKIVKNDPPVINCVKDITVSAFDCKNGKVVANPLVIDPSSCGGNFEISNNSPYATEKFADLSGTYPVGVTKVTFTIKYGCGQKKTCLTNVTVKNDKAPVPICIGSLSVALMGLDTDNDGVNDAGMVELWAKDLNSKSYSTCNNYPLTYSFTPDPKTMNKVFTCDNIGKSKVRMYVTDSKGNQSFCEVELDIQNNGANIKDCKPKPVVAPKTVFNLKGSVKDIYGQAVSKAEIKAVDENNLYTITTKIDTTEQIVKDSFKNLSGYWLYSYEKKKVITTKVDSVYHGQSIVSQVSNDKGEFLFENLVKKGSNANVSAATLSSSLTNIDKADLDALTNHLLGQSTLTGYQLKAADVDQNGKIDIEDMNLLFKFVKGEITSLGNYTHLIVCNDDVSKNKFSYLKVEADIEKADFLAIQLGDIVKEKANANTQLGDLASTSRSAVNTTSSAHVYPNPFTNDLTFEISSEIDQPSSITLYDINGRVSLNQNVDLVKGSNQIKIDAQSIANGIYIYNINSKEGSIKGKLIKL